MKKRFIILSVIIILLFLSSCGGKSEYAREREAKKEAIYQEGYDAGYEEGRWEGYDEGYFYGYEDGYDDGCEEVARAEEEAIFYAKEKGGWHPEEAWMVIEAYRNKEAFYEDGSPPSKQDYDDAVNSLISFYEFFY